MIAEAYRVPTRSFEMDGPIEFVFSFRSPYAWIASRRILPVSHPDTELRLIPFYPLPSFGNFGNLVR